MCLVSDTGGGPLVCATALTFLDTVERNQLLANVRTRGAEVRANAALARAARVATLGIIAGIALAGLTPVTPGQARVIQLFGKYRGTIREPGLQWVNPLTRRIRVSTRIRNHETAQAKVNDADGNPIEIAAVVV